MKSVVLILLCFLLCGLGYGYGCGYGNGFSSLYGFRFFRDNGLLYGNGVRVCGLRFVHLCDLIFSVSCLYKCHDIGEFH